MVMRKTDYPCKNVQSGHSRPARMAFRWRTNSGPILRAYWDKPCYHQTFANRMLGTGVKLRIIMMLLTLMKEREREREIEIEIERDLMIILLFITYLDFVIYYIFGFCYLLHIWILNLTLVVFSFPFGVLPCSLVNLLSSPLNAMPK